MKEQQEQLILLYLPDGTCADAWILVNSVPYMLKSFKERDDVDEVELIDEFRPSK